MRVALAIAVLLIAQPASAEPADLLQQLRRWAYPMPGKPVPLPPARPSVAPPIAKPAVIVPPVASKPPAAKPKPKAQPTVKAKSVARPKSVNRAAASPKEDCEKLPSDCARLKCALNKYGYKRVLLGAIERGYSEFQLGLGRRLCGV